MYNEQESKNKILVGSEIVFQYHFYGGGFSSDLHGNNLKLV